MTTTARVRAGPGLLGLALLLFSAAEAVAQDANDRMIYETSCATCHGADGTGAAPSMLAFEEEPPDFTECTFATREPDADWIAVAHDGGTVRGFSRMMPAFGEALTMDELAAAVRHIRTFCDDDRWAPGELNFPRTLHTEKAYPEDEVVITTFTNLEGRGGINTKNIYERRVGPGSQFEVIVPIGTNEGADGVWRGGIGDVAIGFKHVMYHNAASGSILSAASELILPSGDPDRGLGKGTTIFEPYVAYGQALPAELFVQAQSGFEIPFKTATTKAEVFARAAIGRTFTQGRWGRAWSPMVEILAAREFEEGHRIQWDIVPQMQVTLNTRQHIMLNAGARLPLSDSDVRHAQFVVYVLWEWFDGGLLDGW